MIPITLFINQDDIQTLFPISAQVDPKWYRNFADQVQRRHIDCVLGDPLSNEVQTQLSTNTLTVLNATLLNDYIKPAHVWLLIAEAFPMLNLRVENKGLRINTDDTSAAVSHSAMSWYQDGIRNNGQWYLEQLKKYLVDNATSYPLYEPETCGGGCRTYTGQLYFPKHK